MNQAPVADPRPRPQPATNGQIRDAGAVGAPPPPFVRVQNGWLKRMRGRAVSLRLGSGEVIAGELVGDDSYTLELRIPGHAETALIYKHGVEYIVPAGER